MNKPVIKEIQKATVCLYPMQDVEAVTLIARFHAGSWFEGKSWGAHHMLEHVMLDGSKKYPTEEQIELVKEENGLITNGATGPEILEFYFRAPKSRVSEGFDLLFDAINNPLISEKQIEKNKTVIAQEYKDKWSNPHVRYGRAVNELLYGKTHPYVRDGMGEMDYVQSLHRSSLQNIYEEYCVSGNVVIVAVGNFDEKEILTLITKKISKMKSGAVKTSTIDTVVPPPSSFYWQEDVLKVNIDVYWHTPLLTDKSPLKDRLAVNLGKYILGGSARSRLFKELRTNRGWVYNVSASRGFLPTISWFSVNTSTDHTKAQEVYEILLSETQKVVRNGIPRDEFERAKNYLNMQTLIGYDSVGAIAGKLMNDLFFEGTVYMPEDLNELVNSITSEDVVSLLTLFLKEKPTVATMAKTDPQLTIS